MQFASWQEIIVGVIGLLIGLALFQLFHHFAKEYDKKHPNAPRVSGHYKTPKASYDMSKGEHIFSAVYFSGCNSNFDTGIFIYSRNIVF